ncbi:hypothetical protein EIP91_001747, partial [Steccherinum ochraceum]
MTDPRSEQQSSVDWQLVVAREPENVSRWISYLHIHQMHDLTPALVALTTSYDGIRPGTGPTQWHAYVRTHLPCVLMDIILEEDMFSRNESFKTSYGCLILRILIKFAMVIPCIEHLNHYDTLCKERILGQFLQFCKAMSHCAYVHQSRPIVWLFAGDPEPGPRSTVAGHCSIDPRDEIISFSSPMATEIQQPPSDVLRFQSSDFLPVNSGLLATVAQFAERSRRHDLECLE